MLRSLANSICDRWSLLRVFLKHSPRNLLSSQKHGLSFVIFMGIKPHFYYSRALPTVRPKAVTKHQETKDAHHSIGCAPPPPQAL